MLALLATSDCSFGAEHDILEYPILVAGSAGGALVTGQHIRAEGEVASKVCFSLLRAIGASVRTIPATLPFTPVALTAANAFPTASRADSDLAPLPK